MDPTRGIVLTALLITGAVMVVSGPLVPQVDFTSRDVAPADGQPRINATIQQPPVGSFTFTRGGYGTDVYYLEAPTAEIRIDSISGSPLVLYEIDLYTLNRSLSTVTFLDARTADGTISLAFDAPAIESDQLQSDSYPATVRILTRADNRTTVLYNTSVTVSVRDS